MEQTQVPPKRTAVFEPEFREDLRFWVDTNRKTALRVLLSAGIRARRTLPGKAGVLLSLSVLVLYAGYFLRGWF